MYNSFVYANEMLFDVVFVHLSFIDEEFRILVCHQRYFENYICIIRYEICKRKFRSREYLRIQYNVLYKNIENVEIPMKDDLEYLQWNQHERIYSRLHYRHPPNGITHQIILNFEKIKNLTLPDGAAKTSDKNLSRLSMFKSKHPNQQIN